MVRIAVCDDLEYMREETRKHILRYSFSRNLDYSLDEYENGEALLASGESYDLIFMDYQFEDSGADGISIAAELRKRGDDAAIIFLSAYPAAVFQSFEVKTFRFLVKPITEADFDRAMDAFLQSVKEDAVLTVRLDGMTHLIKESRIVYVEGGGKYCRIHLIDKDGELECHETLAAIEERISAACFYRCCKSYVVNLNHVESYSRTEIVMENQERIPVSRAKYKEFLDVHSDFLAGKRGVV